MLSVDCIGIVKAKNAMAAHFSTPLIQDNPTGWGPNSIPPQFKDMPYQPFSKSDRLGKVICRNCAQQVWSTSFHFLFFFLSFRSRTGAVALTKTVAT